jgi:hypothetical protein
MRAAVLRFYSNRAETGGVHLVFLLLHLLILVYWLGGDIGAFHSAGYVIDTRRSVPERMLALKILNNVDMAPGTALILALPTGLTLACAQSWIALPVPVLAGAWVFFLAWLALFWTMHVKHMTGGLLSRIDVALRWVALAGLTLAGISGFAGIIRLPLFIALKLLVLAACFALGLVVRHQLIPMFPAVRTMLATGATPATDVVVADVLARAKIPVLTIWVLLLIAAWLGISHPL